MVRDDRFSAGAKGTTDPKGMNDWPTTHNRVATDKGAVIDGVSLTEGYKVVKPEGRSPQAVTPNTEGPTPGGKGQPY